MTNGPLPGSPGARRISEAHKGSHPHDAKSGFAANPELASEAGKRGGEMMKAMHGIEFYRQIGRKGGDRVLELYGYEYYAERGRRGGHARAEAMKRRREGEECPYAVPDAKNS